MHAKAYSTKDGILIIPPYGTGGHRFGRISRLSVMDNIRECVYIMLKDEAKADNRVWWYREPYRVTVREEVGERGTYVYSVWRGTGANGKPAVRDQR